MVVVAVFEREMLLRRCDIASVRLLLIRDVPVLGTTTRGMECMVDDVRGDPEKACLYRTQKKFKGNLYHWFHRSSSLLFCINYLSLLLAAVVSIRSGHLLIARTTQVVN